MQLSSNKLGLILVLLLAIYSCKRDDDPISSSSFSTKVTSKDYQVLDSINLSPIQLNNLLNRSDWISVENSIDTTYRRALIEEFTGHTCTFCPNGSREVQNLSNKYGDSLEIVSIHAGSFAVPRPMGNKFTTDFRLPNDSAERYLNKFMVQGYPSAVISRDPPLAAGSATWSNKVDNQIQLSSPLALKVSNFQIPDSTYIRTEITINWFESKSDDYNLQVFLIENGLIDWQLDNGLEVSNYVHNYVLRKAVNGIDGSKLSSPRIDTSQTLNYLYRRSKEWRLENLEVVVFVYKTSTYSNVLQVISTPLM